MRLGILVAASLFASCGDPMGLATTPIGCDWELLEHITVSGADGTCTRLLANEPQAGLQREGADCEDSKRCLLARPGDRVGYLRYRWGDAIGTEVSYRIQLFDSCADPGLTCEGLE